MADSIFCSSLAVLNLFCSILSCLAVVSPTLVGRVGGASANEVGVATRCDVIYEISNTRQLPMTVVASWKEIEREGVSCDPGDSALLSERGREEGPDA